jgi:hypothetical protein
MFSAYRSIARFASVSTMAAGGSVAAAATGTVLGSFAPLDAASTLETRATVSAFSSQSAQAPAGGGPAPTANLLQSWDLLKLALVTTLSHTGIRKVRHDQLTLHFLLLYSDSWTLALLARHTCDLLLGLCPTMLRHQRRALQAPPRGRRPRPRSAPALSGADPRLQAASHWSLCQLAAAAESRLVAAGDVSIAADAARCAPGACGELSPHSAADLAAAAVVDRSPGCLYEIACVRSLLEIIVLVRFVSSILFVLLLSFSPFFFLTFRTSANPTAPIARSTMSRLLLEHALSPRSVALLSNSQSSVLSVASSRCLLVARLVSLLELRSEFLSAVAFALDAQNQRALAPSGAAAAMGSNTAAAAATAVPADEAVAAFAEPPLLR